MSLGPDETGLLEDCYEDWRGLWELTWGEPGRTADHCIGFLRPLVEAGYLTTLRLTDWSQARTAEPMSTTDALVTVSDPSNYAPPEGAGATFYVLSLTTKGEAAIAPGAFPGLRGT